MTGLNLLIVLAAVFGVLGLGGYSQIKNKKGPSINYTGHTGNNSGNKSRKRNIKKKPPSKSNLKIKTKSEYENDSFVKKYTNWKYDQKLSEYRALIGSKKRSKKKQKKKNTRNRTRRNKKRN
jgi:hypothetical protein